jgi:hypothetical protein
VKLKLIAWVTVAACVAVAAGWMWGAAGKSAVDQSFRGAQEQLDFSQAEARILDGRVSLYQVNFGDASRRFESARTFVLQAQVRLREIGQAERAGRLEVVLAHLRDAERLSASLDQSAQNAADAALQALRLAEK